MTNKRTISTELLPTVLLVASVPILFGEIIWSGKPLFGSDFLFYFFPLKKYIHDYVFANGNLPFWNIHQFSGTPLIGNIQAAMFYPLGFLFYLIPTEQAYGYTIMLHCALGAIFMYAFARSLSISKAGAFIAAAVFSYNGFFIAHVYAGHLTCVQSYAWIPLIFLYLLKFVNSLHGKHAILAGIFLGIQILGGFPQLAFYTLLAMILFLTYHLVVRLKHGTMDRALKLTFGMGIILLSGFSLAAIQILPTYELTQLSSRSAGVTYEFATIDSFDPFNFVTFLVPNFFGNPANNTYWKGMEVWQFWELGAYAGIGPFLLLGFLRKDDKMRHVLRFLVLLLLLSLFLCLGQHNPAYRLIHQLPGFNHFRIPAQILYLYVFSLSILTGIGLDGISRVKSYTTCYKTILGLGVLFFAGLVAMLLFEPSLFFSFVFKLIRRPEVSPDLMNRLHEIVWLSGFIRAGFLFLTAGLIHLVYRRLGHHSWAMITLLAVMGVDLWSFASPLIKTTDLNLDQQKSQLIMALNGDRDVHRVAALGDSRTPNDGLLYRYQDIQGYDPLILKRYLSYINRSQNAPFNLEAVNLGHVRYLDNHLIRMLNVKYAFSNDEGAMQQIDDALPRAYIVHKAITVPSERVLDYMMSDDFKPKEMVVFEAPKREEAFSLSPRAPLGMGETAKPESDMPDGTEHCKIQAYENEQIDLTVTTNQDGYLVLSEINYPGWVAYVNGHERQLLTGNYIFRVLPLPKGNHDIVIRFEPRSFRFGIIISAVTLCCLALSLASAFVRNRFR